MTELETSLGGRADLTAAASDAANEELYRTDEFRMQSMKVRECVMAWRAREGSFVRYHPRCALEALLLRTHGLGPPGRWCSTFRATSLHSHRSVLPGTSPAHPAHSRTPARRFSLALNAMFTTGPNARSHIRKKRLGAATLAHTTTPGSPAPA